MSEKNTRLVYSTDPRENQKCPKCKELISECRCPKASGVSSTNFVPVMRIEKQGRGGKTVTVVDRLPKEEVFLKNLCTTLKKLCGSGGTYSTAGKDGVIEIQGDKRPQIRAHFEKLNIQVKG